MLTKYLVLCLFCITVGPVESYDEKCLQNKVAIVTGAAQGIGYAIADNFLKAGVKTVIIVDKQLEKGTEAARELNNKHGAFRAAFIHCDVRRDLEKVYYRILLEYKYVDIIVNNAGILDENNPKSVIDTNTLAVIQWSLKFWQHMRKDRHGRGGTIINISSLFAYTVHPFTPIYTASKYAVLGYSKSLGHEYTYRNTGVRVLALCPGMTYTALTRQQMVTTDQLEDFQKVRKASEWQKPDDVGRGAVQVYETAKSGTAWTIKGGKDPVEAPAIEITTAAYIDSLP